MSPQQPFLDAFERGDVAAAQEWITQQRLSAPGDLRIHPLLREAVEAAGGECYKRPQLAIADLLTPRFVRSFRDAVVDNKTRDVARKLEKTPELVHAEFTAGRGIAQAIHHWRTAQMGQLLIRAGADLDARTSEHGGGETALTVQLRTGGLEGVQLLLRAKVDPNVGRLKFMSSKRMAERVQALLDHGWNIDEGAGERTLLHHYAAHDQGSKVRVLLEHGADPNVLDRHARTALHWVAETGTDAESARALRKAGSRLDALDQDGRTALDLARAAEASAVLEALSEPAADS